MAFKNSILIILSHKVKIDDGFLLAKLDACSLVDNFFSFAFQFSLPSYLSFAS